MILHLARRLGFALALAPLAGTAGAADVNKGAQLYARHCSACHGNAGVPVMPGTPNLSQPATLMRGDAALAAVIRNGRMSMPGFRGLLKDNEVHDVIAFLRTLIR